MIPALRQHAPFDEMDAESLRFLAGGLSLAYYPRGELIVGPGSGMAAKLFIVKQGTVRADARLGPGECFPIGALVAGRAAVYEYRAEGDVFCWELAADDFHSLLARSARFHAFCTNQLAVLIEQAHRAQLARVGEALTDDASMLAPLRSVLSRPAVACAADAPLREALQAMRAQRVGSVVVAGADRIPVGIFTTTDLLNKMPAQDAPLSAAMTAGPVTLEEDATLADAAIAMARRGIRHIVVTRDGRLSGVVSERDLFARQRVSLRRTAERIQLARTEEDLVRAAEDVRSLARHLLGQGIAPEQLTAMASALNDALTQRLIEMILPGDGWCWLALGSEGRMEQTFATDQDNALILSHAEPGRLLPLADKVNRALDAAGFPLCKGDVMARNPRWCLPAEEWRVRFDGWIRNPDAGALLNASIFFDFRPLAGEARLAGALREAVLARSRDNRAFLRAMAESALQSGPPLGLLQDFSADELDLKAGGARIFVDAARILALADGVAETSTARRLRARGEAGAVEAFHFIQGLRLRHGNRLRAEALSVLERRVLKEALREGARLQQRLRMDFGL